MINFSKYQFHPVVHLPNEYKVFDFSKKIHSEQMIIGEYGVGKYNEKRLNMYTSDLFSGDRDIHMGIDISAPVGTEVFSFYHGTIFKMAYNEKKLDYGYTIICEYHFAGDRVYALYGHLSKNSILNKLEGQKIQSGELLGWMGNSDENGGWPPHLHFQLSLERPETCDLPGVVNEKDLPEALKKYPDPRCVLGPLY